MSLHAHVWPFCISTGEGEERPDGTVSVPLLLCDLASCPCWYHDTREEIAA